MLDGEEIEARAVASDFVRRALKGDLAFVLVALDESTGEPFEEALRELIARALALLSIGKRLTQRHGEGVAARRIAIQIAEEYLDHPVDAGDACSYAEARRSVAPLVVRFVEEFAKLRDALSLIETPLDTVGHGTGALALGTILIGLLRSPEWSSASEAFSQEFAEAGE